MTRKKAIMILQNCKELIQQDGQDYFDERDFPLLDMAIEALSAEAVQGEWIPCSERLPEIGKEVLLSEPNAMFIAEYHGSGDSEGLWLVDGVHHYLADANGCAWMPLPTPYKGGEDE